MFLLQLAKHYLGATKEEITTLLDVEMPILDPSITSLDGLSLLDNLKRSSTQLSSLSQQCELYLTLFAKFDSYSQSVFKTITSHTQLSKTLVEEQKAQSMALNVAFTNLESHSKFTNHGIQLFYNLAEKELKKQSALLDTADIDLEILQNIKIHAEFISHSNKTIESSSSPSSSSPTPLNGKTHLIDFINTEQVQTAKKDAIEICVYLTNEIQLLKSVITELKEYEDDLRKQIMEDHDLQTLDTFLVEVQDTRDKAQFLREKIKRDLNRIYTKISELLNVPISSLFSTLSLDSSSSSSSSTTSGSNILTNAIPTSSLASSISSLATNATNVTTTNTTFHGDNISDNKTPMNFKRQDAVLLSSHDIPFPSQAKKTLKAFYHLAEIHVNDYLPKLTNYEFMIRKLVTKLITLKRLSIQNFLKNMNIVSQLQSDIAATSPRLDMANKSLADFKIKYPTSDLEKCRDILFAYGALMIEVVRRKEYGMILIENANVVADLMGRFREHEEDRRNFFRHDIYNTLPFEISGINEASPHFEISTININENTPRITKRDIIEFVSLLNLCYTRALEDLKKNKSGKSKQLKEILDSVDGTKNNNKKKDKYGQDLLNLLNDMNSQLDGLNTDFLKMVETTYFGNEGEINKVASKVDNIDMMMSIRSKQKLLDAEDKVKKYEARIESLEETLQKYQSTTPNNNNNNNNNTQPKIKNINAHNESTNVSEMISETSSNYSVLDDDDDDDDDDDITETENHNNNNNNKKISIKNNEIQELQKLSDELKETVRQREAFIEKVHEQFVKLEDEYHNYKEQAEHEKEELQSHIHEYEQLLEEERQAYEENRKSFLKEAQIKDNLADIRIAEIETEWKTKIKTLTDDLEKEREDNKLHKQRQQDFAALREQYSKELENTNKKLKEFEQIEENRKKENLKLNQQLNDLRKEYSDFKEESNIKLQVVMEEMNDTEGARDEIKQKLAQTRDMVARAEQDWMDKNNALEKLKVSYEEACSKIYDLVIKLNTNLMRSTYKGDDDIISLLDILSKEIDSLAIEASIARENLNALEQSYSSTCQSLETVNEEKMEYQSLAGQMANKLDIIRNGVYFNVTNQLQLSVDEGEAGAMTKKIINPSLDVNQYDTAICNEVLSAINSIDNEKFVGRIRKKVKNAHELTRRWQKEYKELKEKYTKVQLAELEKIAFRNFKEGDVALFLPTRNSSGKPWAAFNINAPHYFLKPTDNILNQMSTREWIVARITSITECVVNAQDHSTNPYDLSDGLVFYQLEVENWRNNKRKHHHHHKKSKHPTHETASTSTITPNSEENEDTATASINSSNKGTISPRSYSIPNNNNNNNNNRQYDIGLASISNSLSQHTMINTPSPPYTQHDIPSSMQSFSTSPTSPFQFNHHHHHNNNNNNNNNNNYSGVVGSSSSNIIHSISLSSPPKSSSSPSDLKNQTCSTSQLNGPPNNKAHTSSPSSSPPPSSTPTIDPFLVWTSSNE
ncbi:unnamed protein product [Cunninghamella blakesleeana]